MSDYNSLRHLADSWGLLAMTLLFLGLVLWALRPQAKTLHDDAARMIFRPENPGSNHDD
ncbi:cbb3-type cytochrome c oxidase subunit 3 [Sandarakinorhabdus oryzae]|uniref:cbb3-type cytochrome c oxidase subunit 3 n=1 Tax=Sandarakinorhabdus oryzae TaxID=2675220 RepID=UPI0012E20B29|nr:cbb3-type cytochrome c oxidase subunit 3 [Sandarakinorhabdus oryzae]